MSERGRIVRAADLVPRPWPNGLGTTCDVAHADGPDGRFAWLVSIADLVRDAAFSHFPDGDRVFTVVEGDAIELAVGDAAPIRSASPVPTHFPGDLPTASRLTGGAARAFNVFVDRRTWRAGVAVLNLASGHTATTAGDVAVAFCVAGRLGIDGGEARPGDTWIGAGPTEIKPRDAPATLILAAIDRR